MTKLFWLSFADPWKPEGEQFLGVSIVAVTDQEADEARAIVMEKFGQVRPHADWFAAAVRKTWSLGINPGGQIGIQELREPPPGLPVDCALTPEQIDQYTKPQ